MNMRSRFSFALAAIAAAVAITACADKVFRPSANASPKMKLQINAINAQLSPTGKPQVLAVVVAYKSNVLIQETDSFRIIAFGTVPVTGSSASVTLNVDLTSCLADPTRKGSQTACSLIYAAFLHDSAEFSADTSDFQKYAYDYQIVGPVDVSPGKPPTLAPISLSESHFAVFQFSGDETLRLGGPLTPNGFTGPITGTVAGVASGNPALLFALTNGNQVTNSCTGGQNNCVPTGYFAAQLAIFQNGTWRRVSAPQGIQQFNDVAAFAVNDVYLAGPNGIFHYDGSTITQVAGTPGENVVSIGAVTSGGSKYVVAGTSAGNAWFGNTTTWTKSNVSNGVAVDGVCVTGPNEAFALNSSSGQLFRFNGTSWTAAPAAFTGPKRDLQCPGPSSAFVNVTNVAIVSWNGSSWSAIPNAPRSGRLAAISNSELYVAGDSASANRNFYRYDGTSWKLVGTSQFVQGISFRPWADPRGGAAYFASQQFGRIDQATPSGAHPVSYSPSIRDAIMTSATSAFAVGWNNFLARWNGATWTVDAPPSNTPNVRILSGVWSDGPSNAWAVGNQATVLHWDGTRWIVVSDLTHPIAQVDDYNAVWGSGGNVWIAGANSILHCRALTLCAPDPVTGIDTLFGIWGTSPTNAWAVGARGKIMHFDGTQWTSVTSPTTHRMVRLWGSSATNVWAVGDSVAVHYDGTAWTVSAQAAKLFQNNGAPPNQFSNAPFQLGLWGAGPNEVYFGQSGGSIHRWDGTEWHEMPSQSQTLTAGGRIVAISGYTGTCGGGGAIVLLDGNASGYVPTLLRGVGPTGCLGSPMPVTTPWP